MFVSTNLNLYAGNGEEVLQARNALGLNVKQTEGYAYSIPRKVQIIITLGPAAKIVSINEHNFSA